MNGVLVVGALEPAANESADNCFTDAFLRTHSRLGRVAAGMGFGKSDADDILQDVFVEASERPGQYHGAAGAERWLIRVTINRCLLEYRRRQRFSRAAGEILRRRQARESDQDADVADSFRAEEIELVRKALREMDGSSAAVLVLRYFCEYNATRIGEILVMPPATVRSRLRTARLLLADRLMRKGIAP